MTYCYRAMTMCKDKIFDKFWVNAKILITDIFFVIGDKLFNLLNFMKYTRNGLVYLS